MPIIYQLGITYLTLALALGTFSQRGMNGASYDIGFRTVGKTNLNEVQVRWKYKGREHLAGAGFLTPGGTANDEIAAPQPPLPEKVMVSWKSADGKRHQQELAVRSRVNDPDHFHGTIWIKFNDAGVKVVPLTDEQMRRMRYFQRDYP